VSFIDGIVNGVKHVLGIDSDESKPKAVAHLDTPKRGEHLAADTPTAFDREPARSYQGPTLAERIGSISSGTSAATTGAASVAPHLTARRESYPAEGTSTDSTTTSTATGASTASTARARVSDATSGQVYGTVDTLGGTDTASTAAANVQRGLDYYAQAFGRNGIDGAGSGVEVLINDHSTDDNGEERFKGNGGYYETVHDDGTATEAIHFGSGTAYGAARGKVDQASMLYADDLAIHELTHGIIRKETGHLGGEADEAGATNEGIADVMAAAATRDWRMGEGMYTERSDYRLMRNIANPNDPSAIHGLWTNIDEVRRRQRAGEEVEEHWASGVISTAAYRVQQRIGGEAGWNAVERVFYDTIDNNRMGDMSFNAVAAGLRQSAASVYGEGSSVDVAVDEELRRAGL
jgi:Zn-dependent metalloprotease